MLAMVFSAFTGINIDGYMGVLVALFIFRSGFMTCKDSVSPLLGSKPDKEFVQDIVDTAMSFPEIIGIHDLLIHDYGVGIPLSLFMLKCHVKWTLWRLMSL